MLILQLIFKPVCVVLKFSDRISTWSHGIYVPGCTFSETLKMNTRGSNINNSDAFYLFSHKFTGFRLKKLNFCTIT